MPIENFLVLAAILFAIGFYGVLARRSAILILVSVEIMLTAVSINMVAFASYLDPDRFTGIIFAIFIITVAAAELALALAIVLRLYRTRSSVNVDEVNLMRW
ncbi:MAG: NADH-quinone oxidoreductase subunit NuoK [Chloroflexi bacterium]|nr:NADH-quinone oxidoreductase subunit NuoK [Chloroflexota bacterium]